MAEVYLPHRCAHQFGYDQHLPAPISFPTGMPADRETLAQCWSSILARETRTTFLSIRSFRTPLFTSEYRKWFNDAIASIAVKPLSYDNMIAEGRTKAIKKKVKGKTMSLPHFTGIDASFLVGPYLVEQISLSGKSSLTFLFFYFFLFYFHTLHFI